MKTKSIRERALNLRDSAKNMASRVLDAAPMARDVAESAKNAARRAKGSARELASNLPGAIEVARKTLPLGGRRIEHHKTKSRDYEITGRHEVSSLRGSHQLAPSPESAGEELLDPHSIEVPFGHSADAAYDPQQWSTKVPLPDTTGATFYSDEDEVLGDGMHEAQLMAAGDDDSVTARPTGGSAGLGTESYDAMSPDDFGTAWLQRATQMSGEGEPPEWSEDAFEHIDRAAIEEGLGATSESSLRISESAEDRLERSAKRPAARRSLPR